MNLAAIRAQVRTNLGGTSRSDLLSGDGLISLDYWINSAYREIAHTFRFSALERLDTSKTTSSSSAFVTVPDGVYAVTDIYDITNSAYLRPIPGGWTEYERKGVLVASAGKPSSWTRFGERLYFDARPDGAYSLRLSAIDEPSALADPDNDSPVLPEVWHDAIVILATRNGWDAIDEEERARALDNPNPPGKYQRFLSRIRLPRAIEQHTSRPRGLRVHRAIRNRSLGI